MLKDYEYLQYVEELSLRIRGIGNKNKTGAGGE